MTDLEKSQAKAVKLWHEGDHAGVVAIMGWPIAVGVAQRIFNSTAVRGTEASLDDVVSWALEHMWIAIPDWNPDENVPLHTWIGNRVEQRVRNIMRNAAAQKRGGDHQRVPLGLPGGRHLEIRRRDIETQEFSADDTDPEDSSYVCDYNTMAHWWSSEARFTGDDLVEAIDLERAMEKLPEDQRLIMVGLAQGATLRELAESLGCSHEWVRQQAKEARAIVEALL